MVTNAEIKHLALLKEKAGREGQARFLVEGKRAVAEALTGNTSIERILVNLAMDRTKFSEIFSAAEERGIAIEEIPAAKFTKLSSTGTSQGILAIGRIRSMTFENALEGLRSKRNALVIILDRISDPGNLGTILRSASWFGVDAVLTGVGSVDLYNPKVVRSAMAAIAELNIVQEVEPRRAIPTIKSIGFKIVASTLNAKQNYFDFNFPQKLCLIFGSEATGIDKKTLEMCEESIMIPRIGKMESLNVGVAASIIMSEILRQRSAHAAAPAVT